MRRLPLVLALSLAAAATGCGEEDRRLLTEGRSETLLELLEQAERQFENGRCEKLADTLDQLGDEVNAVQNDVDEDVRSALTAETQQLVDMQEECEQAEEPVETEPVPPPTTIETLPPPTTETVPPPTTETETEETEEEESPGNGPNGGGPPGQSDGESGAGGGVSPPGGGSDDSEGT